MSIQGGSGYQSPWSSQTGLADIEGTMGELEPLGELTEVGFEPQTRARSNTWPLPRPDNYVDPTDDTGSKKNSNQNLSGAPPLPTTVGKKNSSRRNAWGNLSYADLITQAITSAQDNRLTLSQIYEWMVQNVPYFKDKGDNNSSAGWKNSIRHNLSLHNRFMRVQNEGTGKSSWWMINPDAKPGKSVRRRAASMETSKFEKRRGRGKKKTEALRNGATADATPSPSSSVSESLDMFPDSPMHSSNFQLSPDFRPRAASNASSCGRLSPIPSMIPPEPDWGNDYTPPGGEYTSTSEFSQTDFASDELAGSLADSMKLVGTDPFLSTYVPTTSSSSSGGSYRYSYGCPRHPHGGCACASLYPHPAHPAHPTHPHHNAMDFVRPPPPADPADIMQTENAQTQIVTTSDVALLNGGMMVQTGGMGPTTVMGQIMGALNTGLAEDLNIEALEHGFDCNVDEVINHELSMDGSLDFNFPQQHSGMAAEAESQFAAPAPPVPSTLSGGGAPRTPYSVAPSWVH